MQVKLPIYTFEHVARHVLKKRFPTFSARQLTSWFHSGPKQRHRVVRYLLERTEAVIRMLVQLDLLNRTRYDSFLCLHSTMAATNAVIPVSPGSEMARLFGIDFYSVLTRGSQYRVEAVMLRTALPLGYRLPSASRQQVREFPCIAALHVRFVRGWH